MSETSDQELLKRVVIENSRANDWQTAKTEWQLLTIYDEPDGHCVCHHTIREHCVIKNCLNDNELIVGNVCVNHFNEEQLSVSSNCRSSLKKVLGHVEQVNANKDLLELALRLKIISQNEHDEYKFNTTGRGSRNRFKSDHPDYDDEAFQFRLQINTFITLGFVVNRPRCNCRQYARPRKSDYGYFYGCYSFPGGCKFTRSAV
eukprot:gene10320-11421_t